MKVWESNLCEYSNISLQQHANESDPSPSISFQSIAQQQKRIEPIKKPNDRIDFSEAVSPACPPQAEILIYWC